MKELIAIVTTCMCLVNGWTQQKKTGYAPVNGLNIYYEIHGEGDPIVLIHGSFMNIDLNWGEILPELAKHRKVIALEMQGHGRTNDSERPFSYENMAADVAGLLNHLKIDSADILGYSLGGTVALQFAMKYPEKTNHLVFISSVYARNGWNDQVLTVLDMIVPEFFEKTPLKTMYDSLAPKPDHWRDFVTKLATFEKLEFDLGRDNVKKIKSPVLMIFGDNDGVKLGHVEQMYSALGGCVSGDMAGLPASRLAIIPNATHVTLMMQTDRILDVVEPFLDNEPPSTNMFNH